MVFERVKPHITMTDDERKYLESIIRLRTEEQRMYERARIILTDSDEKNPSTMPVILEQTGQWYIWS